MEDPIYVVLDNDLNIMYQTNGYPGNITDIDWLVIMPKAQYDQKRTEPEWPNNMPSKVQL